LRYKRRSLYNHDKDEETGFYYLRARYYDPNIQRFISEDPHWNTKNMIYGDDPEKWNERESDPNDPKGERTYTYVPDITAIMQSGNLYAYCMNNPIVFVDPTGELVWPGEVHSMVIKQIYNENKYLSKERWLKYHPKTEPLVTLRGRVDLVDIRNGYIWEVKRFNPKYIEAAYEQLSNYARGKFSAKDIAHLKIEIYNGNPDIDGYKLEGIINQNGIYVKYWYFGNGIILYDYAESKERLEEQIKITISSAAAAAVVGLGLLTGVPLIPLLT